MKRKLSVIVALAALFFCQGAYAQLGNMFNHLGASVGVGTDGYGLELSTPVTDFFALRAGISMLPKVKADFTVDIDSDDPAFASKEVKIEGKLNKVDWKVLLDVYPFKNNFRLTGGVFFGEEDLVSAYNTSQFLNPSEWGTAGILLGDYRVTSDENGNVKADIKVNKMKPYVGIGFGRSVPKKRIGFSIDLGVQFWGTPGVYTRAKDDWGEYTMKKLEKDDIDNDDANKALDVLSKISVYPVISFRLNGRIF